ncbi:MAG TPA: hypothetical protein VK358_13140 [Longimicrobium sp.]|nr:hypothetical protein [Longimicrobium sp.]
MSSAPTTHDPAKCGGVMFCATCQEARHPATRPDLSALPLATRINIALAEVVDGRFWEHSVLNEWWLRDGSSGARRSVAILMPSGDLITTSVFRDYLNDPASAWSLMERERVVVAPEPTGEWSATAYGSGRWADPPYYSSPRVASPALALALAVLRRHADSPLSSVIQPLLEEAQRIPGTMVAHGPRA